MVCESAEKESKVAADSAKLPSTVRYLILGVHGCALISFVILHASRGVTTIEINPMFRPDLYI